MTADVSTTRDLLAFLYAQYEPDAASPRVRGLLAVLDVYTPWQEAADTTRSPVLLKQAHYWLAAMEPILKGLAAEFADRPEFRDEWKLP